MRNENRAVFDRTSERYELAIELVQLPLARRSSTGNDQDDDNVSHRSPLARLIALIAGKIRARRNRFALLELSDDQLKDIGLSRSQAYRDHPSDRRNNSHPVERKGL